MSHIFGKTSRKQAVRDATKMEAQWQDMRKALARTMFVAEYMGKILDENGFRSSQVMQRCQDILTGKCDTEIEAEAVKKKEGKDAESRADTESVRDPLSGFVPVEGGQGRDREDAKKQECGDRAIAVENPDAHEGIRQEVP